MFEVDFHLTKKTDREAIKPFNHFAITILLTELRTQESGIYFTAMQLKSRFSGVSSRAKGKCDLAEKILENIGIIWTE